MRNAARVTIFFLCACIGGVMAGELLQRTSSGRDLVGRLSGRGRFVATIRGTTYFERDLADPETVKTIVADDLRRSPQLGTVSDAEIASEMDLLRDQFGGAGLLLAAAEKSLVTESSLRTMVVDHLEVRRWIESQIAPDSAVTEQECRQVYDASADWMQPKRYRASHLFVAAPEGTAADVVVAEKRSAAEGLAVRLLAGEAFATLAAEASEDEATKARGGDLGYFSAARMPPEFIAEVEKLRVGQISPPFHSHLGFHIVQLTDIKPRQPMSFEEARGEIAAGIANDKRAAAVARLLALVTAERFASRGR